MSWQGCGTSHPLSLASPDPVASLQVASKKYEEGEQALQEAQQMQTEQQGRLQVVQRQQEWLRQQEQRVHQARFQPPPSLMPTLLSSH